MGPMTLPSSLSVNSAHLALSDLSKTPVTLTSSLAANQELANGTAKFLEDGRKWTDADSCATTAPSPVTLDASDSKITKNSLSDGLSHRTDLSLANFVKK